MFNFFVLPNSRTENSYEITGKDCNHIVNVLRMKEGDTFLVSCEGKSDLCKITHLENESVIAQIVHENFKDCELPVRIHLFQALPKSDKMELIIQKAVELGVYSITPVETNRCIVKLDSKKKAGKVSRWQAIAESAAKQSKRNLVPEIKNVLTFDEMLEEVKNMSLFLLPYENKNGMKSTREALEQIKNGFDVAILIGPEGGFDESEVQKAKECEAKVISLGSRILRTETAAITAVGMCMLYVETENADD